MSETRWKGAAAGMSYGFAFNDHLQALTAAATAKLAAGAPGQPLEQAPMPAPEATRRSEKT